MQPIRKIAIITTAGHSCAYFLAARLLRTDFDVCIFNQTAPKCSPQSWRYLKRLRKQRGLLVFGDNLLQTLADYVQFSRVGRLLRCGKTSDTLQLEWPILDQHHWASQVDKSCIVQMADVNSSESCESIHRFSPDLILLAGAPIIAERMLLLPRHGVLNPHCGITPDYAGCNPTLWPLYDGRPFDIGYTIHFAIPQVDAGPVVEQFRLPWRTDWSFSTIGSYLLQVMYERLALIVEHWARTGSRPLSQPQQKAKSRPPAGYFAFRIADRHRKRLRKQGIKVIVPPDWSGAFCVTTDVGRLVFQEFSGNPTVIEPAVDAMMLSLS